MQGPLGRFFSLRLSSAQSGGGRSPHVFSAFQGRPVPYPPPTMGGVRYAKGKPIALLAFLFGKKRSGVMRQDATSLSLSPGEVT